MSYQKSNSYHDRDSGSNYIISQPDNTLVTVVIFLVVIGIMAIFSAGSPRAIASGDNPLVFTKRRLAGLGAGLFSVRFFSK